MRPQNLQLKYAALPYLNFQKLLEIVFENRDTTNTAHLNTFDYNT